MRKKAWAEPFVSASPLMADACAAKGRWAEAFGNRNPVHAELGCGKGGFVIEMAAQNPNVNFAAVEADVNAAACAAKSAEAAGLANLRLVLGDAARVLEYFGQGEAERIYINFCDPWRNRAKWRERRLTHGSFLAKYRQALKDGGGVWFKTDNRDLFAFSVGEFKAGGWRLENVTEDLRNSGFTGNVITEYERKFMGEGKPIYRLEAYV